MDFFELEAFRVLVRHGHFAKAAGALNLSPSALSRIVTRLEEEMGARLLDRETRQPTEAGRLFLEFAQESLAKKDELHLLLGASDGSLRGVLRVYASVTACYSLLPPLAKLIQEEHPHLRLSVDTGDPADAAAAVREGSADLALGALSGPGTGDRSSYSIQKTPLVFVTSGEGRFGSLGAPGQGLDPQTLAQVPLILPRRGLARERFDRWARQHSLHPQVAAETAGNEAILALARLGIGLGLVPSLVLENSPFSQGLRILPAQKELGDYDIGFIFASSRGGTRNQDLRQALEDLLVRAYPQGRWI